MHRRRLVRRRRRQLRPGQRAFCRCRTRRQVRQDFVLEWLGGAAAKRFRRARPEEDLPWDTLRSSDYDDDVLTEARAWWTELAANELAAVIQFSSVLAALARAQAPLDLVGMTSDFLADE